MPADSMTKAVMLLPPEKGLALVDATDGAAAYIVVVGTGEKLEVTQSKRFPQFVAD